MKVCLFILISLYSSAEATFLKYSAEQCQQLSGQINSQQQSIDFDSSNYCGVMNKINPDKKATCDGLPSRRNNLQSLRDTYNKKCR